VVIGLERQALNEQRSTNREAQPEHSSSKAVSACTQLRSSACARLRWLGVGAPRAVARGRVGDQQRGPVKQLLHAARREVAVVLEVDAHGVHKVLVEHRDVPQGAADRVARGARRDAHVRDRGAGRRVACTRASALDKY
jgi:hypothetical protein